MANDGFKMKTSNAIIFCVAIALSILIPTVFLPNINETKPWVVFLTTPALFIIGGFISVGGKIGDWKSWVGLSAAVGLAVAAIIHFAV